MKNIIILFTFLILCFASVKLVGQSIVIETQNGDLTYEKLDMIRGFTFLDNNMVMSLSGSSTLSFNLLTLKKLYFDLTTGTEEYEISGTEMVLYPNPVTSSFKIKNAPEEETSAYIYSIQGTKVFQAKVSYEDCEFIVSRLPKGIYFLRIGNQTLKFIKQ